MKILILLITLSISNSIMAKTKICQYNFGMDEISISYLNEKSSYKKDFNINNRAYKVFIKDISKPNEVEDYISITDIANPKYKITYALNCAK
jgi:hypothetical protein